jgi:peptidoglycan/xylan/chitin deacetylase (PgdA/CDA1 family)
MQTDLFTRSERRAKSKALWAGLLRASGILPLAKSWVRRRGTLVLTFHRVLPDAELQQTASLPGMVVRQKTFDAFLGYAADQCEFVDLKQDIDWQRGSRLKLAITFDDGWSDNALIAYPIASRHRAPMVIFIVAEKMGTSLPFWPERTAAVLDRRRTSPGLVQSRNHIEQTIEDLKGLPANERNRRIGQLISDQLTAQSFSHVDQTMGWEEVAQLHRGGVTFGSHTSTHEILTTVPLAQAEEEIAGSRGRIEKKLGAPCRLFSYPNGDFSESVRDLVQQAGYKLAFLNQDPGIWTERCDPYLIPRVNVCEHHLVDVKGKFSPLIFEYAVVWSAAKGLLGQMRTNTLRKLRRKWQGWVTRLIGANRQEVS